MSIFTEERARIQKQKDEQFEADHAEAIREQKLIGVEFEGVMCSVHKEDQWGLATVKEMIYAGQSIPFHFKNGNVLLLTPANIAAFEQTWTAYRMSFF